MVLIGVFDFRRWVNLIIKQSIVADVVDLIKSFDHVAMTVENFDNTIDWYVKNLGFSVERRIENRERGTRIAFLATCGKVMLEFLGFFEPQKAVAGPTLKNEETGIKHVSFFIDNMDEICSRLKNAGAEFTTYTPTRSVFKDPNGILIELRTQ